MSLFFKTSELLTSYGLNLLHCFIAKVSYIIPSEIKQSKSVEQFKTKIQDWEPDGRYCKPY